MDAEIISQIRSEVDSETGFTSSHSESSHSEAVDASPFVRNSAVGALPYYAGSEGEEAKRAFLSQAVFIKLSLPPHHMGRDILISDLYNQAMNAGVPRTQWTSFLRARLGANTH
jgi:hypothetical protein